MNLNKAEKIARRELNDRGLVDWSFRFDRAVSRFGVCKFRIRETTMSKTLTELNDEGQFVDVLLHEIAHALVGRGNGHNYIWKRKAIEVGCSSQRCYTNEVKTPPKKYAGTCPKCKREIEVNKRNRVSCGKCSNRFNPDYLFTYKIN